MGWVEICNSTQSGATDWRLFRSVAKQIELTEKGNQGISFRKVLRYVDSKERLSEPKLVNHVNQYAKIFKFKFRDGSYRHVDPALVLPSGSKILLRSCCRNSEESSVR